MSNEEEVRAAERKMRGWQSELSAYNRRPQAEQDVAKRRHLAKALKDATDEYMRLVLDLTPRDGPK